MTLKSESTGSDVGFTVDDIFDTLTAYPELPTESVDEEVCGVDLYEDLQVLEDSQSLVFLTIVESKKFDDGLVYQQEAAVRQRLAEMRQFLFPMSDQHFHQLMHHLGTLLIPVNAPSEVCRNHSQHLLNSLLDGDMWALKMVDASGKLGLQSGILDGHIQNFGNFAECLGVVEPASMFRGQHCAIELSGALSGELADVLVRENLPVVSDDALYSLCVPSTCSEHDVFAHVDTALADLGIKGIRPYPRLLVDLKKIRCSTADGLPFRTKDYCAMFAFGSLIFVVALASITGAKQGWLSCFSLPSNFREMMDMREHPGEITCLNGLRVLTAFQVVLAHRMVAFAASMTKHYGTLYKAFVGPSSFAMALAELLFPRTVDVFFLLSGLTLSYNFLLKVKRKEEFNYFAHIYKRYFRVTPILAAVVLYHSTLFVHSARGPWWLNLGAAFENLCYRNWWSTLLYISNIVDPNAICVGESWYLACDFQLQCLAPIVLLLFLHRPKLALFITSVIFVLCIASTLAIAFYAELTSGFFVTLTFWEKLSFVHINSFFRGTFFRADSFCMGLIVGYVMVHCPRSGNFLSKLSAWFGWVATIVSFVCLYVANKEIVSPDHQYMPLWDPLFVGFSRFTYCACVSWLVFACHSGYGGYINSFLSHPVFRVIRKLTFSLYLIHIPLQLLQAATHQTLPTLRYTQQLYLLMGDILFDLIVAAVLYMTVETPFAKLSLYFLKGSKRRLNKDKKP